MRPSLHSTVVSAGEDGESWKYQCIDGDGGTAAESLQSECYSTFRHASLFSAYSKYGDRSRGPWQPQTLGEPFRDDRRFRALIDEGADWMPGAVSIDYAYARGSEKHGHWRRERSLSNVRCLNCLRFAEGVVERRVMPVTTRRAILLGSALSRLVSSEAVSTQVIVRDVLLAF